MGIFKISFKVWILLFTFKLLLTDKTHWFFFWIKTFIFFFWLKKWLTYIKWQSIRTIFDLPDFVIWNFNLCIWSLHKHSRVERTFLGPPHVGNRYYLCGLPLIGGWVAHTGARAVRPWAKCGFNQSPPSAFLKATEYKPQGH